MRSSIRYLAVMAALLSFPEITHAQDEGGGAERRAQQEANRRETRQIQQQQEAGQRAYEANRRQINEFLRNPLGTNSNVRFSWAYREQLRLNASRDDLMELAENLQRLFDLGRTLVLDQSARDQIEELSDDSCDGVEKLLDFVNLGTKPPPTEPITIPDETFQQRTARVEELFRGFLMPMATLIMSDTLDLKMLAQTRSDLVQMDALIRAIPDAHFQ